MLNVKKIYFQNGDFCYVDAEDYNGLICHPWYLGKNGYPSGSHYNKDKQGPNKTEVFYMHRVIAGAKIGEHVDHINGDKKDNRKANLRIVTKQQNAFNAKMHKDNKVGYKGVRRKPNGRYYAVITKNGKSYWLGTVDTAKEAAFYYNCAAQELFGIHAKLNEIKSNLD